MEKLLKFTFHDGVEKVHVYLKMPSPIYAVLKQEVEMSLFQERNVLRKELRTYWIDEDGDEIDVVNQCDYEIFLAKFPDKQHMQVCFKETKINPEAARGTEKADAASDSTALTVHRYVECDVCKMNPIVGFRYNCVECENFDLCQGCEAKHEHAEHLMLRMPTAKCSISLWPGKRYNSRMFKHLPHGMPTSQPPMDDSPEHHRHHRRSHRNQMRRQGLFSQMYEIMNDLAEGGVSTRDKATNSNDDDKAKTPNTDAAKNAKQSSKTAVQAAAADAARAAAADAADAARIAAADAAKVAHLVAADAAQAAHAAAADAAHAAAAAVANGMFKCPMQTATSSNVNFYGTSGNGEKSDDINMKKNANPKTPPPTPTTAPTDPSDPMESAPKRQATVPVLDFNTITQYIDPETMKTGIQILNNFSDMFAKMLDPMTGGSNATECPILNLSSRKSSVNSAGLDSSTASTSASSIQSNSQDNYVGKEQAADGTATTASKQADDKIMEENKVDGEIIEDVGSDCESEQSESNRWQLLDKPTTSSPQQSVTPNKDINYDQLSKDLKAHVEEEKRRATVIDKETTPASVADASVTTTSVVTNAPSAPSDNEHSATIYHQDAIINSAVHAMMAMGFSNEGAWLTQLLESTNGNISQALDLMSVAQRNTR